MAEKTWEEFVRDENLDIRGFNLLKDQAYIRKVGNEWCIFGEGGKRLGCYPSRPAAENRLKEIEMFKHMKQGGEEVEYSSQECYCRSCGSYFFTRGNRRCDQSRCPFCNEPDDIIEITGVID